LCRQEVEYLLSLPNVASIVLMAEDCELSAAFPGRIGYFRAGRTDLKLPARMAKEFLYIGNWGEFGTRAAFCTWLAGARGIWNASAVENSHRDLLVGVFLRKLSNSAVHRLGSALSFIERHARRNETL